MPSLHVCTEPDCPTLTDRTRCAVHRSERERERGTRQQRGYDADYQRARARAVRDAGPTCPRCRQPYTSDNPPTGGHKVAIRNGGSTADGVEDQCRRCNLGWVRTGL